MHIREKMTKNPVRSVNIIDQSKGKQKGQEGNSCRSGWLLSHLQEIEKEKGASKDQQAVYYNGYIETVRAHISSVWHRGWYGRYRAFVPPGNGFPCIYSVP